MPGLRDILREIDDLSERELTRWVEEHWVLPAEEGGRWHFSDVDVARIRLICACRFDYGIDEEALPVILSLLDQLYSTRDRLRRISEALAHQPESVRIEILNYLESGGPEDN